nr:MAG TPA: hypothetical protein [Caudoviricetes sp.]
MRNGYLLFNFHLKIINKSRVHVWKICYNQPIKEVSQNVFKTENLLHL